MLDDRVVCTASDGLTTEVDASGLCTIILSSTCRPLPLLVLRAAEVMVIGACRYKQLVQASLFTLMAITVYPRLSNGTQLAPVEDKSNDVVALRRRAVTATDLDTLADRFRVDMIHIFMVFLILKKKDYISMALISFRRTTLWVMSWKKNWSKRV